MGAFIRAILRALTTSKTPNPSMLAKARIALVDQMAVTPIAVVIKLTVALVPKLRPSILKNVETLLKDEKYRDVILNHLRTSSLKGDKATLASRFASVIEDINSTPANWSKLSRFLTGLTVDEAVNVAVWVGGWGGVLGLISEDDEYLRPFLAAIITEASSTHYASLVKSDDTDTITQFLNTVKHTYQMPEALTLSILYFVSQGFDNAKDLMSFIEETYGEIADDSRTAISIAASNLITMSKSSLIESHFKLYTTNDRSLEEQFNLWKQVHGKDSVKESIQEVTWVKEEKVKTKKTDGEGTSGSPETVKDSGSTTTNETNTDISKQKVAYEYVRAANVRFDNMRKKLGLTREEFKELVDICRNFKLDILC